MASASTRALWKGAISFGLVHIPVALHSATAETRAKFNLLDKRTMSPIGNSQVNKTTGEAVQRDEIVKGIEVDEGQFVVLTKEEIKAALPKSTQTIEIESFVDVDDIPTAFYQKPYHVVPINKGHKAYALLRETLKRTGKAGVARVVISTKQHFAALVPQGDVLVLNLMRWADEVRDTEGLPLPEEGMADAGVSERELKMAEQLVNDLATEWSPGLFHDEFKEKLQALVEKKAQAGDMALVQPLPGEEVETSAEVLDLTELLRQSLANRQTPLPAPARARAAKAAAPAAAAKARRTGAANDEAKELRAAAAAKPSSKARAAVKPRGRG